jgi:hypothetical protein
VLKARCAEIQQQSTTATSDAEIVDQLRYFEWADGVQCFQFDKDLAVADKVDGVEQR